MKAGPQQRKIVYCILAIWDYIISVNHNASNVVVTKIELNISLCLKSWPLGKMAKQTRLVSMFLISKPSVARNLLFGLLPPRVGLIADGWNVNSNWPDLITAASPEEFGSFRFTPSKVFMPSSYLFLTLTKILTSPATMMPLFETERKNLVKKNITRATTVIRLVTAVMIAVGD